MNKTECWSRIESKIDQEIVARFGEYGNNVRIRGALMTIAQIAFNEGQSYALFSLLTVRDVAERLGISERRVRAIAKIQHDRWSTGWQIPGTSIWLFREEELESLRPGDIGRPSKLP